MAESIHIGFDGPTAAVRAAAEAARSAERDVKGLENALLEARRTGEQVSGTQVDALNKARLKADVRQEYVQFQRELKREAAKLKKDVMAWSGGLETSSPGSRLDKYRQEVLKKENEDRRHANERRTVFNYVKNNLANFASGNIYEATKNVLFERDTQTALNAMGMTRLAGFLKKAGPAAIAIDYAVKAAEGIVDRSNDDRASKTHIADLYAKGKISPEAYSRLMAKGGTLNNLNPFGDSAAQKREHMLATMNSYGLEDNTKTENRLKRFYMRAAAEQMVEANKLPIEKQFSNKALQKIQTGPFESGLLGRNRQLLNEYIKQVDKEIAEHRAKYGMGHTEKEAAIGADIVSRMTYQNPANWWFADALKDFEVQAKADQIDHEKKHPKRLQTLTEKYEYDNDILTRKAQWNVYQRGYVPFNNVE